MCIQSTVDVKQISRLGFEYEFVYFYPPMKVLKDLEPEQVYPGNIEVSKDIFRPSLYFHIPFCTGRCTYCHYTRWMQRSSDTKVVDEYLAGLQREFQLLKNVLPLDYSEIDAIHFGGGTPTILSLEQIRNIMDFVRNELHITCKAEITWESTPETILQDQNRAKIATLLESGVNRFSIGIQSFEDPLLRIMGRRHNAADAIEAFKIARETGFGNINIDLIYGLPGQRVEQWENTLDVVGQLLPESVTCYQLRVKQGTPISRFDRSRFPTETDCLSMGSLMLDKLESFGYYAWQPNQFALGSEHAYRYLKSKWEGPKEVIGVGVSAYSFVNNWMYANSRMLDEYYKRIRSGRLPITIGKKLSWEQQIAKTIVLGIKVLPDGVDKKAFEKRFGLSIENVYEPIISRLEAAGLIESTNESLRLTRDGLLFADEVCTEFYAPEDRQALRKSGATPYGSYLDAIG